MKCKECKLETINTCKDTDSTDTIAKKIKETNCRHLYVLDSEDKPIGIVSLIDINNHVTAENKKASEVKAKEIMTKEIQINDCEDNIGDAYSKMQKLGKACCAITDSGKFKGTLHYDEAVYCLAKIYNEWKEKNE